MDELLSVLSRARSLLSSSDNDFIWSTWADQTAATADIDSWIDKIKDDCSSDISQLKLLFAPTGGIQEVAVSSGWGEEYLALARSFDEAIASLSP